MPKKINKVLIVEDDESSTEFFYSILKTKVNELYHAENGNDALVLFKQHPDTDIILLDIKLPGLNGYEISRKIREFDKKVIIIAQTAYAMLGDKEKALEAGCNNYITKPIDRQEMIDMLNSYI